jgi:hypothetical protein
MDNVVSDLIVSTEPSLVTVTGLNNVASSPIFVLPPELLAFIIELATLRIARWNEDDWIYRALRDWIPSIHDQRQAATLSLVCRAWRALALDTACLWSAPRLELDAEKESYNLNPLCLERSQQSLVSIIIDTSEERARVVRDQWGSPLHGVLLTAEWMRRVRDLWFPCAASLAQLDSPALESFLGRSQRMDLPQSAPQLRTLLLHDVYLFDEQLDELVRSPLLAQLTRLAVECYPHWWQTRDDVPRLLSVIECASSLTDLAIRNYLRTQDMRWDVTNVPLRDVAVLPCLRRITLVGDQIFMVALLQHIQLPADVELWLQPADTVAPDAAELEVQMQFVQLHLSHPAHTPVKLVLKPMAIPSYDKDRHSWRDSIDVELYRADGRRMLCLPLRLPLSHDDFLSRLTALVNAVPWVSMAEVHLRTSSAPPVTLLHAALRAPRLAVLHASAPALDSGMAALISAPPASDGDAHTAEPCLPALRKLVAVGMHAADLGYVEVLLRQRRDAGTLVLEALELEDAELEVSSWTAAATLATVVCSYFSTT